MCVLLGVVEKHITCQLSSLIFAFSDILVKVQKWNIFSLDYVFIVLFNSMITPVCAL